MVIRLESGDHGVVAAAHIDAAHVVGILTVDIGDLHHHIILLAVLLEARHLAAAEHGLERAAERVDLDAHGRGLIPIHGNIELRRVHPEIGVDIDEAGIIARLVQKRVDHLLQLVVGPRGLDHEIDWLRARVLTKRRRVARERHDAGDGNHLRRDGAADLLLRALTLVPRLDAQNDAALRDGRIAGDHEHAIRLRHGERNLLELLGVGVGVFDGGAFRAAEHGDDVALILDRGELALERA